MCVCVCVCLNSNQCLLLLLLSGCVRGIGVAIIRSFETIFNAKFRVAWIPINKL